MVPGLVQTWATAPSSFRGPTAAPAFGNMISGPLHAWGQGFQGPAAEPGERRGKLGAKTGAHLGYKASGFSGSRSSTRFCRNVSKPLRIVAVSSTSQSGELGRAFMSHSTCTNGPPQVMLLGRWLGLNVQAVQAGQTEHEPRVDASQHLHTAEHQHILTP